MAIFDGAGLFEAQAVEVGFFGTESYRKCAQMVYRVIEEAERIFKKDKEDMTGEERYK